LDWTNAVVASFVLLSVVVGVTEVGQDEPDVVKAGAASGAKYVLTQPVFAAWVPPVDTPVDAVGTMGTPVNVGDASGAYVLVNVAFRACRYVYRLPWLGAVRLPDHAEP
jgi:hypothetical protein